MTTTSAGIVDLYVHTVDDGPAILAAVQRVEQRLARVEGELRAIRAGLRLAEPVEDEPVE